MPAKPKKFPKTRKKIEDAVYKDHVKDCAIQDCGVDKAYSLGYPIVAAHMLLTEVSLLGWAVSGHNLKKNNTPDLQKLIESDTQVIKMLGSNIQDNDEWLEWRSQFGDGVVCPKCKAINFSEMTPPVPVRNCANCGTDIPEQTKSL